jgi:hypothetical protein
MREVCGRFPIRENFTEGHEDNEEFARIVSFPGSHLDSGDFHWYVRPVSVFARRLIFLISPGLILQAAAGQPIDARNELIFPVNPPRKASPNRVPVIPPFRWPLAWTLPADEPDANPQLKISGAELAEDASGNRELSLSVSHLGTVGFDPSKVRVMVHFFERDEEGRVELSGSKIVSQWASPPIDWEDAVSEKLVLQYPGPAGDSGRKYAGWLVLVSLENRLQDVRGSSPQFLSRMVAAGGQLLTQGLPPIPSAGTEESERFLAAYKSFQAAERAFLRGSFTEAKEAVDSVISSLKVLQKENPGWQPQVVAYRLKSAQTLLAAIEAK